MLSKRKQRYFNNNKQLKNITFSTTKDFEIFYQLLKLSKKKYQSKPTHSFDELNQLQTIFPSQIKLIISKYKEQIVGGSLLFFTNSCSCLVFYNVISSKYRDTQLSALQLFYCMQYANKKGARVLDFGVSHSPEQKNVLDPKFSLIEFKEQLGAQGVLRTVFQKKYDVK
jgi:lipid II:glycine glycyltransferase (peptidoglycan interpeptide bridge formation enzyme)